MMACKPFSYEVLTVPQIKSLYNHFKYSFQRVSSESWWYTFTKIDWIALHLDSCQLAGNEDACAINWHKLKCGEWFPILGWTTYTRTADELELHSCVGWASSKQRHTEVAKTKWRKDSLELRTKWRNDSLELRTKSRNDSLEVSGRGEHLTQGNVRLC